MVSHVGDNLSGGPFVVFNVCLCPACKCEAGFQGVDCESAFVYGGCTWGGEEGGGYEAPCGLIGRY
jgi:hypothetical protein